MAKRSRTHLAGKAEQHRLAPKHLTLQEFGRRLYNLMLKKGWRQADLARASGLPRDSISTYVRGTVRPTEESLKKVASALGVKPEELFPNILEDAIDADNPSVEMKISTSDPGKAWLRLNRLVDTSTAVKIIEIIHAEDTASRK